jgi:RNA polymerase sigma-70 factor (ECF subfamily)
MHEKQHDPREDLELIRTVQNGDQKAFDVLVIRYQSRVCKIVSRFVKDQNEVFDVCQEVFIKTYRALKNFRGDSSFYTWLYRISINTAKNYLMAREHQLPSIDFEIVDMERFSAKNGPKENGTPEHLMMRDEMEHLVYDAIDHLPKDLKTAIMLREIEGLSYDKIANIMHCPVGTVRSRIFRARAVIDKAVFPLMQQ